MTDIRLLFRTIMLITNRALTMLCAILVLAKTFGMALNTRLLQPTCPTSWAVTPRYCSATGLSGSSI